MRKTTVLLRIAAVLPLLAAADGNAQDGAPSAADIAAVRQQRQAVVQNRRRILFDNDGCDAAYFPVDREATPQNLLDIRTTPLAGSHVDALFYCTICSGFGLFTFDTRQGEVLTRNMPDRKNITADLLAQGTDPLKVMSAFCRENGLELFWSMRMNDTHDAAHRPEKPHPLWPQLKEDHPEFLIGSRAAPPKHGAWSSVDYTHPEIRNLAFRFFQEVCRNYDIDGIGLDFFRHMSYFKNVAFGAHASETELDAMTDLIRRVRRMTEEEGAKRGRPILVSVRVPDSAEYSKAVGLDLERWMAEGLVDFVVGSGYFRLNFWDYLVELGKKHDVPVFAGLSESRVRGEDKRFRRQSLESYRGRAAAAWQAGVAGIYIFNIYNAGARFLQEIGEPEELQGLDKLYFATVLDGGPERYVSNGDRFRQVPIVTPNNPLILKHGEEHTIVLEMGNEASSAAEAGLKPVVTCHLQVRGARRLAAKLNGARLPPGTASGHWLDIPVGLELLRPGRNRLGLSLVDQGQPEAREEEWDIIFSGDQLPAAPWHGERPRDSTTAQAKDGALFIADRGTESGDYMYYYYPWGVDPADETVVEARAKVVSGWNNVIVCNGTAGERVSLYPDRVQMYRSGIRYEMDTTDDFHVYRIVLKNNDIMVYVDGELRIDGTDKFNPPVTPAGRNNVSFGAANSGSLGEAYWDYVRFRTGTVSIFDVLVSVKHQRP